MEQWGVGTGIYGADRGGVVSMGGKGGGILGC
jgi:hypothetical protein